MHVGRDWSTVLPPAARCCSESSHSPLTRGAGKSIPAAPAAPNNMHPLRYIRAVIWLVAYIGTCNLSPRGWTEDRAVDPAEFLYFLPTDRTASSNSNPLPRQPLGSLFTTVVAAKCACPRVTPTQFYFYCRPTAPPAASPPRACKQSSYGRRLCVPRRHPGAWIPPRR